MNKIKTNMLELFNQLDPEGKLVSESIRTDFADAVVELTERQVAAKVSKIRKLTSESTQEVVPVVAITEEEIALRIKEAVLTERKRIVEFSKTKILSERAKVIDQAKTKINEAKEKYSLVENKSTQEIDVSKMQEQLVEMVSKFLDEHVAAVRPAGEVISEHEIKQLKQFRQTVRDLTIVNEMDLRNEIKESFDDGLATINALEAKVEKLITEKESINSKLDEATTINVLSDKLSGLAPKKRAFLESMFKGSTATEIEEKFDEAKKAFELDDNSTRKIVAESKKTKQSAIPKAKLPESVNPKSSRKPRVEKTATKLNETVDPEIQRYADMINRTNS
jgi:hypothetical protein